MSGYKVGVLVVAVCAAYLAAYACQVRFYHYKHKENEYILKIIKRGQDTATAESDTLKIRKHE